MALKKARQSVQRLLGAEYDSEIVFTSCGTEADSPRSSRRSRAQPERKTIITTVVEHPAILSLCDYLAEDGYTVHKLKVDKKGRLNLDEYAALLDDDVAIVSVMWANNETGTLFPVEQMAQMADDAGVMFHSDAVQAVGKVPMNLRAAPSHALVRPQAACAQGRRGALPAPRHALPALLRGGHQERGRRAGTENAASIIGLGVAAERALAFMEHENTGSAACATSSRPAFSPPCPTPSSPAIRAIACRTPPTSPSNTSRARPSCCC